MRGSGILHFGGGSGRKRKVEGLTGYDDMDPRLQYDEDEDEGEDEDEDGDEEMNGGMCTEPIACTLERWTERPNFKGGLLGGTNLIR